MKNKMELRPNDMAWLIRKLPSDLIYHLKQYAKTNDKVVIAGGYIRSSIGQEHVNDIDIFVTSKELAGRLVSELEPSREKQFITENAYSITIQGRSIQIIHRWTFDNPEAILKHFDFTVAQAAMWLEYKDKKHIWNSLCTEEFYYDLAAKRLVYTLPADPEAGASLLRLLKFRARGYNPTLDTLAQIVARTAGVESDEILRKLREVDPASPELRTQLAEND
jgi:hypothetical protein